MAETPLKRQRDETQIENGEEEAYSKRQKSYDDILSLLESEEEEPNQDLSSLITTLQQELSSESGSNPNNSFGSGETDPENPTMALVEDYMTCSSSNSPRVLKEDEPEEEEEKERVMRHLLEASDDELGIPNREEAGLYGEEVFNGGEDIGFSVKEGLWELEDEAANYYALLQSELFI